MAEVLEARKARYRQELEKATKTFTTQFVKIPYFKIEEGEQIKLRVMPGLDPGSTDKDFYCRAIVHYNISPNSPHIPVTSPKSSDPSAYCPMAEKVKQLKNSSSKADQQQALLMKPSTRYYMCVVPREGENAGKVMVYSAPRTVWEQIIALMDDSDYGDITDPLEGQDLKITRSGKGLNTTYNVMPVPKKTPTSHPLSTDQDEMEDMLKNQFDLSMFRDAPSADEIKLYMSGSISQFTTGGLAPKPIEATSKEVKKTVAASPHVDDEPVVIAQPIKKKISNLDALKSKLEKEEG